MIQWWEKKMHFLFQFNFCCMRTTFEDVVIANVNRLCARVMRIKRVVMYYQEDFIPGRWTFGRKWKRSKDARYEQNQFHFRRNPLLKKTIKHAQAKRNNLEPDIWCACWILQRQRKVCPVSCSVPAFVPLTWRMKLWWADLVTQRKVLSVSQK